MKQHSQPTSWNFGRSHSPNEAGGPIAARLLNVVDAGLAAIICVAPFVFGGRHELGRFVFLSLTAVTAAAWFLRQSLLPKAAWTRTAAHVLLLLAISLVVVQLIPLPATWIDQLAPHVAELLPLWTPDHAAAGPGAELGNWSTLSLTPHDTMLSLAMLLSYALLFVVLTQRIQSAADVERLLGVVAVAVVLMAGFGLLQYFGSNGRFFWCYDHPYRTTDILATGSFMNRNHFASFLVLGIGPLVRWLVVMLRRHEAAAAAHRRPTSNNPTYIPVLLLSVALVIVLTAIALSLSRGGAIALFAAAAVLSAVYWWWRMLDARYLGGLAALALVMLAILSVYGYDRVAKRFDDFAEGSIDAVDHGDARRKVWAANVSAIQNGWLTGYGAGSHRDVCPVYLTESTSSYYTHAENGYLQIATENGVVGAALLASALLVCGGWCVTCLMRLTGDAERLCFGAAAAGLAAIAVHSLVDFVWYIPACMSVTLVLAVCVLRLAQLAAETAGSREQGAGSRERGARSGEQDVAGSQSSAPGTMLWLSRPTWIEMAAVVILVGGWTVYTYFGPAIASIHWDRYLRASVANSRLVRAQLSVLEDHQESISPVAAEPLSDIMIGHLEKTVVWDPLSARAHLKLAGKYLLRFELAQQDAENAMPLQQIRDAALASKFSSTEELRDWLNRAFGENAQWLYRAYDHAGRAAALSPLQGEAYLYLANLCFLERAAPPLVEAYVDQGLRVRPHDGGVLFEVGMHKLLTGQLEDVISIWAKCFRDSGTHQLRIVQTLAGRIPAAVFIQEFQPDWRTLREIWARYRQFGQPQDLAQLVAYAAEVTKRQVAEEEGAKGAYIWLWQALMYDDVGRPDDALVCLEQAYRSKSHIYSVRLALGQALIKAGRFNEAEAHVRWCLARRPENKSLSAALVEITKQRFAQRTEPVSR